MPKPRARTQDSLESKRVRAEAGGASEEEQDFQTAGWGHIDHIRVGGSGWQTAGPRVLLCQPYRYTLFELTQASSIQRDQAGRKSGTRSCPHLPAPHPGTPTASWHLPPCLPSPFPPAAWELTGSETEIGCQENSDTGADVLLKFTPHTLNPEP